VLAGIVFCRRRDQSFNVCAVCCFFCTKKSNKIADDPDKKKHHHVNHDQEMMLKQKSQATSLVMPIQSTNGFVASPSTYNLNSTHTSYPPLDYHDGNNNTSLQSHQVLTRSINLREIEAENHKANMKSSKMFNALNRTRVQECASDGEEDILYERQQTSYL